MKSNSRAAASSSTMDLKEVSMGARLTFEVGRVDFDRCDFEEDEEILADVSGRLSLRLSGTLDTISSRKRGGYKLTYTWHHHPMTSPNS